ncbi:hypothetical protein DE146DRAFT_728896 [Phaeosphaeria sp. MPI-PUGE-AT-0046c]|nr:hypothetical protein DE146DRAFT_728896 [Phaeosphaeria sp. MPI-PUGE-AT-0046c]
MPPALRLYVPDFACSDPNAGSTSRSPHDTSCFDQACGESDSAIGPPPIPHPVKSAPNRSPTGNLCLTVSTIYVSQPTTAGVVLGTESPLIFCDIDSDISSTPSPAEPPTSAISATSTNATSVSGCAGKRALSRSLSPELLSKKMRSMTVPVNTSQPTMEHATESSSGRRSIGGDNRYLTRTPTFIERSHGEWEYTDPDIEHDLPELSSFRPEAVDPQGIPLKLVTPISRRNSWTTARDHTPELAETPIYARSLHLVDTEVSIYHKVHGDEWKQNSLCLYCFRRHGGFCKLKAHGYELCGYDEPLESLYWESLD